MDVKYNTPSPNKIDMAEHLLWKVLWKPLGLPKDIRQRFKLAGNELILLAKCHNEVCGAIVAFQTTESEYELRHIAVEGMYQKKGIGRNLVQQMEHRLKGMGIRTIQTIARHTSLGFFKTLGYETIKDFPDPPDFKQHGISFVLMKKSLR